MKLQHPPDGHRMKEERDAALARAEAAENALAVAQAEARGMTALYDASVITAEKRVQELEAQLAAQEWRPVTKPPTDEGEYWGWDAHDGVFITHYTPDRDYDDDWAWSDYNGEMIPVDMWSPLISPPPPTPSNSTG